MTIIYTSASAYFVVAQYSIQPTHKQNPSCETTHLRHVTPFVKNDILFGPNKNHETSCFLVGVFNPSEKYHIYIYSHIDHLPQIGVNIKHIWNHHLVHPSSASSKWAPLPTNPLCTLILSRYFLRCNRVASTVAIFCSVCLADFMILGFGFVASIWQAPGWICSQVHW